MGKSVNKREKRAARKPKRRVVADVDATYGRKVAVKRNPDVVQAQQEYRAMGSYPPNPYLVRPCRFFLGRDMGCIEMEWIEGKTLREVIQDRGPIEPAKTISIAQQILAGLDILHRAGYVHGDLHSENVIVTDFDRGAIKIIDLQHAVAADPSGRASAKRRLSRPPPALAPESKTGVLDARYDIYGVGYMIASMLLGKEPKKGVDKRKARPEDAALWEVVKTATDPDPARRYGTPQEMTRALHRCTGNPVPMHFRWRIGTYDGR